MTQSSTNIFEIINSFCKSAPVDVEGAVRALGLDLHEAYLKNSISGMIEKKGEGYLVTVNASDALTRKRFTIAHELGHFLYHRDRIGNGVDDDRLYRSTDKGIYHNTKIGPREETQANQFAATLLMPWELIHNLKDQGCVEPEEFAEQLEVSRQAFCIRVGIRTLTPPGTRSGFPFTS